MLKMTIDNEEVLSNNDISIKEEILSPSSTILNNVYPKSWELDKDYTSRFYYPKDYSKLNIQNFSIEPEEAGTTIQVNGSATLTDVDTSKESRVLRLLGQTSQTGTPTPSSPIPINVVSGDNYIDICGKNLFDLTQTPDETNNVNFNVVNGILTQTNSGIYARTGWFVEDLTPNVSYTLNINYSNPSGSTLQIRTYKEDKTTSLGQTSAVTNTSGVFQLTITPTEKKCYIRIYSNSTGTSNNNIVEFSNIQLEKGSTATTYEPYIGNSYPIYLGVENLINVTATTQTINGVTFTINSDNTISVNGTATANTNLNIHSSASVLKANTNYYLSGCPSGGSSSTYNLQFYSSPTQLRDTGSGLLINRTADTSGYVRIQILNGTTLNNLTFKPQLVEGSTPQHTSTTPIELCKIGTYQDYIYKENDKWYLHKEIGKVVLNGSESWAKYSGTKRYYLQMEDILTPSTNNEKALIISNLFTVQTANYTSGATTVDAIALQNDEILLVRYVAYNDETLANFKTWLSTNNITLHYVLPTSTNTEITDTTLLEQLESLSS